jgi:hypothetical protein
MLFGVPTIGDTTIENVHKTKAGVLAIEAARTIVLDQPEDFITGYCEQTQPSTGSVWPVMACLVATYSDQPG